MNQPALLQPPEKPGTEALQKSSMSTIGNRVPSGLRSKTTTPRVTSNGDSRSQPVAEDPQGAGLKSRSSSARRPAMRPLTNTSSYKRPSSLSAGSAMKLENQLLIKRKRFVTLKKELTDKQRLMQDLYNEISQLREKVIASGAKDPGKIDEVRIEVGSVRRALSPSTDPSAQEDQGEPSGKPSIDAEFIESVENRLREIPKKSQDLCLEILDQHSTMIDSIVEFVADSMKASPDSIQEINVKYSELLGQIQKHQKETEALKTRVEEVKDDQTELTDLIKDVYSLYEEYRTSRDRQANENQRNTQMQLNSVMMELQMERERNNQAKERARQAETQLQKARTKIRELEAHVSSDEGKIQHLQNSVKSLEGQMRQKDQAIEQRIKDMQKAMKNNESLVAKVEKQRDSFESRLMELKEQMNNKEVEASNTIRQLEKKLNFMNADLAAEKEKRERTEEALAETEQRCKTLEEKSEQLCELAEKSKDFAVSDGNHTENEVQLFNDLQAARAEVEEQKEKILQLQQEKDEIIAVMHQAASRDDDDSKEKLAAELVFKSTELQNLLIEYTELKKVAKNAQERNGRLEKQLIEIQGRLQAWLREGGNAASNAHTIELQQQISDLQSNLAEVTRHKEELETTLTQKQLEIEQRDRVMREQSKLLKVRDELLGILKGRSSMQGNENVLHGDENNEDMDEVSKQIAAKTEAIQELYATLESKQLQVMRLEKMVKLMEDQQDRAQAQRTRLENRIAQLELALQKNKEHRNKGFGIL